MRTSLLPLLFELSELSNFYYPRSTLLQPYSFYNRPLALMASSDLARYLDTSTQITKDGFQINLDVEHYAPNEITVKTVENDIIIEGKHEERKDEEGSIARQFTRRITLPRGYDIKEVVSTLSSDGVLTVKAPALPESEKEANVRNIQIQQTGPARYNVDKSEKKAEGTEKPTTEGGVTEGTNTVEDTTNARQKRD